ncbi:MAG: four helix bundle protein [bacterium]
MNDYEKYLNQLDQNEKSRPHHSLKVWKRSLEFVKDVYQVTANFPDEELYGLASQMRKAATSIASNIAEGAARNTQKEFLNFLHMAQGSNSELETQLLISSELGYSETSRIKELLEENGEISRMIVGLQNSIGDEL